MSVAVGGEIGILLGFSVGCLVSVGSNAEGGVGPFLLLQLARYAPPPRSAINKKKFFLETVFLSLSIFIFLRSV